MKKNNTTGNILTGKIPPKHFLLIMRTVFILLFTCVFCSMAEMSYTQNARVTIHKRNATLREVLTEIENQTDYLFIYNNEVNVNEKVSIRAKQQAVSNVLTSLLKDKDVSYSMEGNHIILSMIEKADDAEKEVVVAVVQQQKKTITGKVVDEHGEPVIGANIIETGTTNGTVTDVDGNFSLQVANDATIRITFIGYLEQSIPTAGKSAFSITLLEDTKALDEVVVIGYGTVRKRDLTGSVSQITADKFEKSSAISTMAALQGRIPGMSITIGSGTPGDHGDVLIHGVQSINGTNAPIYVIDGTITDNSNNINLQDVASISVLKDASAVAIYGSRAANGVIVITTKRGEDKVPTITFRTEQSIQQEGNLRLKFVNADQWLELATECYENARRTVPWSSDDLNVLKGTNNIWPDLVKRTGYMTNNNLSVSGGSQKSTYFIALNYMYNKGIIQNQDYSRLNLRLNSDHMIGKFITFGHSFNLFASQKSTQREQDGRDTYHASFRYTPLNRMYESNGDLATINNTYLQGKTPSPLWMLANSDVSNHYKGISGNLYLSLDIIDGLKATVRQSIEWQNGRGTNFMGAMDGKYGMEGANVNTINKDSQDDLHYITDFLLDFNRTFKEVHNINALLGYSIEKSTSETLFGKRGDTPSNYIRYLDAGDPNTSTNGNGYIEWAFLSTFARVGYSYKDKYYINGTIRRDGTSRLTKNKYGSFPSVSAAWRITEESFMENFNYINELKLRMSYGTVGNVQSITPYGTAVYLSQRNAVFNQKVTVGYTFANAVNTNLKWESTTKKNLGLDISVLRNRLYFIGDYYEEDTRDLLFEQPIPYSVGLSGSPYINAGHVRNRGFDIELGWRESVSDWKYDINVNFTHIKNKVIDLEGRNLMTSGIKEGYPVRSFFGYKSNGLIRSQEDLDSSPQYPGKNIGDIWLLDIDSYDADGNLTGKPDGKVDAADRTLFSDVFPDFSYGIFGSIRYKNLTLQVQLHGISGLKKNMLNGNWATDRFNGEPNMEADYILDRFHITKNPDGKYPKVDASDSGQNGLFSDFWLVDASYLSIRNINLNYNFPARFANKLSSTDLSVYCGVQNLWTFGNEYAEISSTVSAPIPRTITFGLKFSF
jgi:TonB-linked SusC/RagA family outer membrane protein